MGAKNNRITSLTLGPEHVDAQNSAVAYGHPDITLELDTRGRRRYRDRRRNNPPQAPHRIPPARTFTRRNSPPATAHLRHNASQKQSRRQPPPFPSQVPSLPTSIPQPSSKDSNGKSPTHFPTDPPSSTVPPLPLPVDSHLRGNDRQKEPGVCSWPKVRPS